MIKAVLKKNNKAGGINVSDFEIQYKATVVKIIVTKIKTDT